MIIGNKFNGYLVNYDPDTEERMKFVDRDNSKAVMRIQHCLCR
jgi:hypothetical protein